MKTITILIFSILASGCITIDRYPKYIHWDTDGNNLLNRYEFLSGYMKSNVFLGWSNRGAISEKQFYQSIFNHLDVDNDTLLNCEEFHARIDNFYFNMFNGNFNEWDEDRNDVLDKSEFQRHAARTRLFTRWDTNENKKISEREMAKGMFSMCDMDNNKAIDTFEFNIWAANR